jgi:hypothetical protein
MTREKWSKMTADDRLIKVAELCVWQENRGYWWNDMLDKSRPKSDDGIRTFAGIPDYLNDLNAMHEAENTILGAIAFVRRRYYQNLDAITGDPWNTIVATAAQRAEAFALTLEPEDKS